MVKMRDLTLRDVMELPQDLRDESALGLVGKYVESIDDILIEACTDDEKWSAVAEVADFLAVVMAGLNASSKRATNDAGNKQDESDSQDSQAD